MASFILRFSVLCFLSIFHQIASAQTIIRGNIRAKNLSKVMLFQPVNGFSNSILAKSEWRVHPDQDGNFSKLIELEMPSTLVLQIGLEPVWIFVEPNDTIEVSINLYKFTNESPNGGILFAGKNAKGNEYFNYFNFQPGKKLYDFKSIIDSLGFYQNYNLNSLEIGIKLLTHRFDSLLASGHITKAFHEGVVPGVQAMLLCTQFRYFLSERPINEFSQGLLMTRKILERFPFDLMRLKSSIFIYSIGNWVSKIKEYEHYTEKNKSDSIISKNGRDFLVKGDLKNWLFLPKDVQEVLWPLNLLSLKGMFAESFGHGDVEAYLAVFPESPLKAYLQPPYFGNLVAKNRTDSSRIHIIQDSAYLSLTEFINSNFKNNKLYVDFWASWCAPCKFEFGFNEDLDTFFDKYNITRLYVSFDEPHLHNSMISNIYSYDLKGYHIRVNRPMYQEVVRRFYPSGQISIPRYMIVNEKGEILNEDAPRPSDQTELFEALKLAFGIYDH